MAVKYTICVILMIKFFWQNFVKTKTKRGQSKAQQQYIYGFFKKKPCERQVYAVQCRSEPIHQAGASKPAN